MGYCTMGHGQRFKVDFKAAGNRALKEWGALFERCDGGQGSKRGVGRQCAQELRGGCAQVQPQTQATFAATV